MHDSTVCKKICLESFNVLSCQKQQCHERWVLNSPKAQKLPTKLVHTLKGGSYRGLLFRCLGDVKQVVMYF